MALLIITAACIGCRFFARWKIQDARIGVDDWVILISYIVLIPATILIIISQSSRHDLIVLHILTLRY